MKWTTDDIPALGGKLAVVTGANSGVGYETARELARKGACVVLACRDEQKGKRAMARIRAEQPGAALELVHLDLSDLETVRRFAAHFAQTHTVLNILCNNAGLMAIPYRKTADGYEMQFGINHLGHFALTGLLLDALRSTPGARVVTVSSSMHKVGQINFADVHSERGYAPWGAYSQSKLANLLFTYELQRKFEAARVDAISVAAHPGYARTNLHSGGAQMGGSPLMEGMLQVGNLLWAQSARMGALPQLYAATATDVRGGDYLGPGGFLEQHGHPVKVQSSAAARDPAAAARLWTLSEELTGVHYAL
jgi:NAD(P)-dependent dehydrogenase (short-subunit alcohol dehydrogenase family)